MSFEIIKFEEYLENICEEITTLLHHAYAELSSAGMNSTIQQSAETTLLRLQSGDSFLGYLNNELVATITVVSKGTSDPIEWFSRPGVFFFTQFAVKTEAQGNGVGARLLEFAESFAKKEGAVELALDTSEKADSLVAWYRNRGYRFIECCQLPGTSYRSIILSKNLCFLVK